MHGHRLAVILAAVSREDYSMRCDMACQANEGVVLEAADHSVVRDNVGQDHLGTARRTTHRSHAYTTPTPGREYRHRPRCSAVTRYAVDNAAPEDVLAALGLERRTVSHSDDCREDHRARATRRA